MVVTAYLDLWVALVRVSTHMLEYSKPIGNGDWGFEVVGSNHEWVTLTHPRIIRSNLDLGNFLSLPADNLIGVSDLEGFSTRLRASERVLEQWRRQEKDTQALHGVISSVLEEHGRIFEAVEKFQT